MAHFVFILVCSIWGASFILMKKASIAFGPLSIASLRVMFAASTLALIWAIRKPHGRVELNRYLLLFVIFGFAWPFSVQPYLIERIGSGFIGMMVSLVPIATVVFSVPLLGTFPSRRQFIGICGGLLFLLVLWKDGLDRQISPFDLLLAATVPIGYAVANITVKKHFSATPPLTLAVIGQCLTGLIVIPLALRTEAVPQDYGASTGQAILCIAFLGIVGTGLCQYWFVWLIQWKGPLYAGMATYLIPLGALLWGWVDNERITMLQVVSLVGVITMVALVQTPSKQDIALHRLEADPDHQGA